MSRCRCCICYKGLRRVGACCSIAHGTYILMAVVKYGSPSTIADSIQAEPSPTDREMIVNVNVGARDVQVVASPPGGRSTCTCGGWGGGGWFVSGHA